MSRVEWLAVDVVGPSSPRAVLHTVLHRVPRTLTVPLSVAAQLAASGVPLVVHRHHDTSSDEA